MGGAPIKLGADISQFGAQMNERIFCASLNIANNSQTLAEAFSINPTRGRKLASGLLLNKELGSLPKLK
jgi:hypothetical protein